MRRTEQVQGLRLMKFEEVYGRTHRGGLSQAEAAEVLGVSERTFRRWRDRYEAEGADGLYDRRLGRLSARRAPVDEVARVLELFDTRYWDFTAKHFHEKLVADHGFKRSYNWLRLSLQAHGRRRAAPRRGAHRRKRPRRALPGMMLHQDGSSHEWVPGRWWDLIVTMDDATSDIYSAFFVAEEGTMSSFQGVSEAIRAKGLFCSLYADRASHYWNTPEAGGKVDKDTPTQVGRALAQLGIELIPAYSPEARGRSERMFGTLQKRLPQELRLAGITDMVEANRFLKEVFLPQHNARFATPAEDRGTAFVPFTGALDDILCIHEERTVSNDNTVRYKRLALQIPAGRHRRHYVKARVRVHEYPDGTMAVFYHRAECLTHVGDSQAVRSLTQCGEPMRFAMAAPIDLRNDFDSVSLRRLAKRTRDATQSRRLLALAEVYDGGSRTDASRIGGVGLQIIRDWVLRFNARGPDGLVDGKSPGAPSKLNADHRRALAEVVEAGPVPAVDGVVRWRRKDLARWLLETFAISLDETTVGRELKALGFAKISARPRHYAQNELAVEAFKKNFPAELAKIRARLPKGVEIELWWQDEARIGQKNKLTRRWARRGTRPRAPRDQRTEWAYIFGAICPAKGKGAGLVMPWCDTDAMAAHLIEISAAVDPGAHAVLIVDQAGWHLTPKLAIPDNITVLALPPRSPELNPVENVWQFMRDNWLSNRIFKSYEDIVALCCQAWNNLIDQPWKIMSLGMRKWAHGF